eukprot:5095581-Amphidinium_carterae.1
MAASSHCRQCRREAIKLSINTVGRPQADKIIPNKMKNISGTHNHELAVTKPYQFVNKVHSHNVWFISQFISQWQQCGGSNSR